jgi:CHAT domain-containing protein/Tfp pilus assembly protein PilF
MKLRLAALIVMSALMSFPSVSQDVGAPSLVVDDVLPNSIASRSGLRAGDRVTSYDGKSLPSPAALQAFEENTFNKSQVLIRVRRGDEALTFTALPGKLGVRVRPEPPSAAWLQIRIGESREGERQWKEAAEAYAAAWELLKNSGDAAAQSRTLAALARCSQNLNDFPAALRWYEQAEKIDASSGNEFWASSDLAAMGNVALNRGDLSAARDYHTQALRIRERLAPDSLDVAASFYGLGGVAYAQGDLPMAQEYLVRSLSIRERLAPDSLDVAASVTRLGNVAYRQGNYPAAADYYNRALGIQERLAPDSPAVAASFNNLGNLALERGDLAAAQRNYGRSLAIHERVAPGSLNVGTALSNLGVAAYERGDFAASLDYYNRALAIRQRLAPDSLDVSSTLANLGTLLSDLGDVAAAEAHFSRAHAINQRLAPESLNASLSLFNLGDVARRRGDLAAADDYFTRGLRIRERLAPDSQRVALSLNHLGKVARERGDLTAAEGYQSRALALHEKLAPSSPYISVTLNDLGLIAWSQGDLPGAEDYLRRALTLREQISPASLKVAETLNNLGGIALERQRFTEALPLFVRAVDIIESQRWQVRSAETRALLIAQHTGSYTGLIRTQLALNDLPGAFATAERARARSLLDILSEGIIDIREGVDPGVLAAERSIQQELNDTAYRQTQLLNGSHTEEQAAAIKKELDELLMQYQELQAEVRLKSPRYAALTQPKPLGLTEIQQLLTDNTLLLEYVLDADGSHVFAVTADSIKSFALPTRAEIEMAARRVVELMMARQPLRSETLRQRQSRIAKADAEYPAAAAALSRMVLGPLAGELSGQRLLIVADGALQYVPFAALPASDKDSLTPLIVAHEVVNLPSASVAAMMRRDSDDRPVAEKLVAVLADPVFDSQDPRVQRARQGQSFQPVAASLPSRVSQAVRSAGLVDDRGSLSRLPFTREEADAIFAAAPAGRATKATDFKASRATVTGSELSQHRVVHLATHGLLDTENPELSGIALSLVDEQGRAQDGFLRLHEVYNLRWSADLVVLSACQTALGKEIRGEGLVGLTRGFMYAGSKRVLASLWNVNDSVTAQLMKQFYQGMFVKGMHPAAALRAAQLEIWSRRASRSPYYWAAFVLQGEWK